MEVMQWNSNIPISSNHDRHLKWWDTKYQAEANRLQICQRHDYIVDRTTFRTYLLYSQGIGRHIDDEIDTPYSALLILYNKGFLVYQEGLDCAHQSPGAVILLNVHRPHELAQVDGRCTKWAAISVDYYHPLPPDVIEAQLNKAYSRIFN